MFMATAFSSFDAPSDGALSDFARAILQINYGAIRKNSLTRMGTFKRVLNGADDRFARIPFAEIDCNRGQFDFRSRPVARNVYVPVVRPGSGTTMPGAL
ncbi:TPA: hypothetical protein QDB02_001824 [Burkholderia vietnamiensis]|nr:hypothetical protein [Burkholderia vietnamiensis]HDR9054110.1 hypothetical protein [Burkholderia vietnamiensis]